MEPAQPSRRAFVQLAGTAAGAAWISVNLPALTHAAEIARERAKRQEAFAVLTTREAEDLEALTSLIIPSSEGVPGAREAGVVHFADHVLGTLEAPSLGLLREGLAGLADRTPGGAPFASLTEEDQSRVLREVESEDEAFFQYVRYLTVAGTFCHPDLGGNRGEVGWRLLGMRVLPSYQPPFGHYDEPYNRGGRQ